MYKRINVVLTFKQLAMQEILEAIKEKAKKKVECFIFHGKQNHMWLNTKIMVQMGISGN